MKIKLLAFAALGALMLQPLTGTPSVAQDKEVRVGFLGGLSGGRGIFGKVQKGRLRARP